MNVTCNDSWVNINRNSSRQLNGLIFGNQSAPCTEHPSPAVNPLEDLFRVAFGSSIFIFMVSLITVLANSFLLLTFLVDPLKIFRNPSTYFLIGLAIVDLLTGLVQEPIYATCFMFLYFQHPLTKKCGSFMRFASSFARFSISISSTIVFAFTLTQYIVVSSPLKYGRMVTKNKVLISVVAIYLYHALFGCLPLMGVQQKIEDVIDIFLHNYAVVIVTVIFYILLHYAMKKNMAAGRSLQNEGTSTSRKEGRHIQMQRNFVRINVVLLIVLIVFFVPSVILLTVRFFMEELFTAYAIKVQIINLMTDNLLYLKFLLDPFVYAWRMPKYRASLRRTVFRHKDISRETSYSRNGIESTVTELNKSAITLLSFKNVPTD